MWPTKVQRNRAMVIRFLTNIWEFKIDQRPKVDTPFFYVINACNGWDHRLGSQII